MLSAKDGMSNKPIAKSDVLNAVQIIFHTGRGEVSSTVPTRGRYLDALMVGGQFRHLGQGLVVTEEDGRTCMARAG